jgi:steroid 5-alpha reductase family enzyme
MLIAVTLSPWQQLAAIAPVASLLMLVLWVIQQRTRDAGLVDAGWAFGLGSAAMFAGISGSGESWHRWSIAVIAGLWGLRLAAYLLVDRVLAGHEDGRYAELRAQWGPRASARFFWFFQVQAASILILALPFVLAASNAVPGLGVLGWFAVGVWTLGFAGEAIADRQLARFRADPSNKGRTCRAGLWRYSRHPNYFFEWTMWVAYAMLAWPTPLGWLGVLSPLIIYLLITRVTGIPPAEARSLRSRGEEYRDYQRTTSAFFPWFPRSRPPEKQDT